MPAMHHSDHIGNGSKGLIGSPSAFLSKASPAMHSRISKAINTPAFRSLHRLLPLCLAGRPALPDARANASLCGEPWDRFDPHCGKIRSGVSVRTECGHLVFPAVFQRITPSPQNRSGFAGLSIDNFNGIVNATLILDHSDTEKVYH